MKTGLDIGTFLNHGFIAAVQKEPTMLAYIEVLATDLEERSGRNERGFWQIRKQNAYLFQNEPYPVPFPLFLEDGQLPYKPGKYLLGAGSFQSMKGKMELSRNTALVPFEEAISLMRQSKPTPQSAAA